MALEASVQPAFGTASASTSADALRELRGLVGQSASRWKRWTILEAAALAVGLPLAYLWLVFLLDNLVHLPVWGRVVANSIFLIATLYLVISFLRRWRRLQLTEDQVALAMERETPGGVQNRLINALQISRDERTGHVDFGHAVIEENYKTLQGVGLQQAGELRPAMLRVGFACAMIVAGILFWSLQREHFQNAASRIMMPLAGVDPIYKTILDVEPGNVEGAGDVPIRIHIRGRIPSELTLLRVVDGERAAETISNESGSENVRYTLKAVSRSMTYAVRGGDFTSPYYTITVPTPSSLVGVKVTYQFPAYTKLAEKTVQSAGGDLEALVGTKAKVIFTLDHAAGGASLLLHRAAAAQTQPTTQAAAATRPQASGTADVQREPLEKLSPTQFAGEITFTDVLGYQLETRQPGRPRDVSTRYALHVRADEEPVLRLTGLETQAEAPPDAVLALTVDASDDFGLQRVGLYARKVSEGFGSAAQDGSPDDGWKALEVWPVERSLQLRKDVRLSLTTLGGAEGDKFEIALRAADTDPIKKGALTTGQTYSLALGGVDIALQLLYEQILRSEAGLKALITSEEATGAEVAKWLQKLNPNSGLRWDDKANLDALTAGVKTLASAQETTRKSSGQSARKMVSQAGNLCISVGMLADSEMVRVIRILEAVPTRDTPQAKRAAMTDAKVTVERTVTSLREISKQYARFREDWELSNILPFIKMLADRQASMRDASAKAAATPAVTPGASASASDEAAHRTAAARRQTKLAQLCELSKVAFDGLAKRVNTDEPVMAKAFTAASASLSAPELKAAMTEAAAFASQGRWADCAVRQDVAAKALASIHQQLQAAKAEAARLALAALAEKAKSDVEAQKELERLRKGNAENALVNVDEAQLKVAEIIHMREVAAGKKGQTSEDAADNPYRFDGANSAALQSADTGKRQKFDHLKLASTPGATPGRFPNQSDRASNSVKPHIQQEFEDLVGDLLEEADALAEKYDTYNINLGVNIDEAGDVGKQGGEMNSTAASAATGNQKPPPADQGGISRQGRMGGRAHGMVMGEQGVNRRGRDKVQEGQERVPDQAGTIKQQHSADEQKDISTGIGGKKVDTDDPTTFNTGDKGTFTDDMADRMGKVAKKNSIVERQDGKLDPRIADMLRDLNGTQEQVIERLKAIRKDLKNLYLPTDQIDEAIAQLAANLESLEERPTADVFRLQAQALDKLRSALSVFTQYGAGFQSSLPREQAVRGRVLDEPARQTIPGYENAVKSYYEALSTPAGTFPAR